MKKLLPLTILVLILTACTGPASENQVQTAIAQTDAAQPTNPPAPSNTPLPSKTFTPAYSPTPTFTKTPRPTATPKPTSTPVPQPITLNGTGDDVVDVDKNFSTSIAHIKGNAAGRYFGIESYDKNNQQIDLWVNTTDPYDGLRLIDISDFDDTARLQITAVGEWEITIYPIHETTFIALGNFISVPGTFSGNGDYVLLVNGSPTTATITGNSAGRYFGAEAYSTGSGYDLLVNTTDPYTGTVLIDPTTVLIQITAKDDWTIELED